MCILWTFSKAYGLAGPWVTAHKDDRLRESIEQPVLECLPRPQPNDVSLAVREFPPKAAASGNDRSRSATTDAALSRISLLASMKAMAACWAMELTENGTTVPRIPSGKVRLGENVTQTNGGRRIRISLADGASNHRVLAVLAAHKPLT